MSESGYLVQNEYKCRLDWVRKGIHLELCKGLKFDYNDIVHKPESAQENEIPSNFEIKTDHPILIRKLHLVLNKKKERTYHRADFAVTSKPI